MQVNNSKHVSNAQRALGFVSVLLLSIKQPIKTIAQKEVIIQYAKENGELKSSDLTSLLSVGETRTKALLRELVSEGVLIALGEPTEQLQIRTRLNVDRYNLFLFCV